MNDHKDERIFLKNVLYLGLKITVFGINSSNKVY